MTRPTHAHANADTPAPRRVAGGSGFLLLSLLLLTSALPAAQALKLGIFPYFSAERLVALHKPLKDYLASRLGRSIHMVSAPDFATFGQRTRAGEYDLLITAPHLGRLAQRQAGYRWLGITSKHPEAIFMARRDSGLQRVSDLAGKHLALPPEPTIIHQVALEILERNGLQPGRDVQILPRKSHDQALYAVLRGKADAAALGLPTWQRYDAPDKRSLMVIGRVGRIPGFALMAHPRLAGETLETLRQVLSDFAGQPAGRRYFHATGLQGVRPVTPQDLALLDHHLERIRAVGSATRP